MSDIFKINLTNIWTQQPWKTFNYIFSLNIFYYIIRNGIGQKLYNNNYRAEEFTLKGAIWLDVTGSWPLKTQRLHSINGHFSTSRWRYLVTVAKQMAMLLNVILLLNYLFKNIQLYFFREIQMISSFDALFEDLNSFESFLELLRVISRRSLRHSKW